MKKHWVWVILIVFILASLTPMLAVALPPIPFAPYGTVKLNDNNVPDGTAIRAFCGNIQYGFTTTYTYNGHSSYYMEVPGDDPETPEKEGCSIGERVTFLVNTADAQQSVGWTSGTQILNLTATKPVADIAIKKQVNGQNADAPPGPYLLAGTSLTWTYIVTNTGEVALSNVVVIDDNGTPANTADDVQVCGPFSLAIDASKTCSRSGSVILGPYVNIATVTGKPPDDPPVTASDLAHYFGANPKAAVEFKVNGNNADNAPGLYVLAGTEITLSYVVSNTGNVSLTNLVVKEGGSTICTIPELGVGANQTCTRKITALGGQRSASATVTATPPGGLANITSAPDWMYYFGATLDLHLVLKTNGQVVTALPGVYVLTGSTVNWSYELTNNSNVTLTNIRVVDDNGTPGNPGDDHTVCSGITLDPGGIHTCTWSKTAAAGQYTNVATARANPPSPLAEIQTTATSHYFGVTINVNFVKRTNGQDAKTSTGPLIPVGGAVNWTYTVTSSSNVSLPFTVVDNPVVAISCPKNTLNPTDEVVCTASGTAVAGQYTNTATLTVTTPGSLANITRNDTSHYFGVITGVNIEKLTNGFDADQAPGPLIKVGEPITWRYVITNTGNVDLTAVSVVDDQEGAISTCPTTLAASATVTCTKTGTAEEGQYSNLAKVTGNPPAGFEQVTDSDPSHYYGSEAGVTIKKLTNGVDIDEADPPYILVGDPVSWTYVATNIGNLPLREVVVTDSDPTLVISCPGNTLSPSASMTCTANGTAKAGIYSNTGYVEGTPEGLEGVIGKVQNSDVSGYFGADPSIEITKTTNGEDAKLAPGPLIKVGEPITWRYMITNTGNVDLTGVSVVDDEEGIIATCPTMLAASATVTCTITGTAEEGQYSNLATVTGNPPAGFGPVTDSDPSHYFGVDPGVRIKKLTNGVDIDAADPPYILVGNPVNWTYQVSNVGNLQLAGVSVTDSDASLVISCPKATLPTGASMTCTASGTAVAGEYENTGIVKALPAGLSEQVQDYDVSGYFGAEPVIRLTMFTNGEDAKHAPGPYIPVGQPVVFTYQITSQDTRYIFTEIAVTDDSGVTVTCPVTTLEPGNDPIMCTASGTAGLGQQNLAGHVTAKALIHPTQDVLGRVETSDTSHYFGYALGLGLVKLTDGQQVPAPPGPEFAVGSTVTWTYEVTNTSNVPLTDIEVEDDQEGAVICPPGELGVGQSITCSASGTVIAGEYRNEAYASGKFGQETVKSSVAVSYHQGTSGYSIFLPLILR